MPGVCEYCRATLNQVTVATTRHPKSFRDYWLPKLAIHCLVLVSTRSRNNLVFVLTLSQPLEVLVLSQSGYILVSVQLVLNTTLAFNICMSPL